MEFKKPKPKKNSSPGRLLLPLENDKTIMGVFNGQFVTVRDLNSMLYLYKEGNFGKGTLSKGEPIHSSKKDDIPRIILQSQLKNQINCVVNPSYFHSKSCLETIRTDYELSFKSVSSFLDSCFSGEKQNSWKSWKEMNKSESVNLNKKCNCNRELLCLEFKRDDTDYRDYEFINIVNDILHLKKLKKPHNVNPKTEQVIIVNKSLDPQETNLSTANINAHLEMLVFSPSENLNLNLEESFFLKSVFGCLNIVDLNFSELSIEDLWVKFSAVNKCFTERYITYHYYRSKGWIVRSGLKYGGDYLLYKDGPTYYHASYLVKVLDKRKKLTWREFLSMNRLVETFNKDLILSNIVPSKTTANKQSFPDLLKNHSVQEILVKRWFPSKERFTRKDEVPS